MKEEKVRINEGQKLIDVLKDMDGESNIPSNAILCKTLTGIGATYCEIHSERNSIIIEPNIPVILGKLGRHNDLNLEAVYSKCEPIPISKYLSQKDENYKKILCTPESFKKIRHAAHNLGINIYKEYFCLFDECEKLTQDVDYRREITQPIYDFFKFEKKAFVSATILNMTHPDFENQGFTRYIIDPTFNYKKDIELIATNDFYKALGNKLESIKKSKAICLFMNKTDAIGEIINRFNIKDYKVFCSQKSVTKMKVKKEVFSSFENLDLPLAKYNFFTSRFFSALDIELRKTQPDVIMLTNLDEALYTMIDPFTEAIQIVGRFRNGVNSITHITNIKEKLIVKSENSLKTEINQFKKDYSALKKNYENATNEDERTACLKSIDSLPYKKLILDEQENVNYFSVDNLYNEERVKRYYTDISLLKKAYEETGHFEVMCETRSEMVGQDDILRLHQKINLKDRISELVYFLEKINIDCESIKITQEQKTNNTNRLRVIKDADLIIEAYSKIGKLGIENAEYKKTNIQKAIKEYDKKQFEIQRFRSEILEEIKNEFELNKSIPASEIKQKLNAIFQEKEIRFNVTQETIKDYYECTSSNSKEKKYPYTLKKFKF